MSRERIIERERRARPFVVAASVLPLLLLLAGNAFQSAAIESADLPTEALRSISAESASFILGSVIIAVAFGLLGVPLIYLFKAAKARSDRVLGGLVGVVVAGPVLFAVQNILQAVGRVEVADEFVKEETRVGDIYSLFINLFEGSSLISIAALLQSVGVIALVIAVVYSALWGMRTGLLTRFFATLGMALAGFFFLSGAVTGAGQLGGTALLAWFMYFGFLLWGRTRGGRPPAWDAGEAIPWPKPGEEPVATTAGGEVIEGDASEIPGVDENPNAARRERAKKRKRKRRR